MTCTKATTLAAGRWASDPLPNERTLLALNSGGEAASEGHLRILLVGLVAMNRLRRPARFGVILSRVVLKAAQSSWTSTAPSFRDRAA